MKLHEVAPRSQRVSSSHAAYPGKYKKQEQYEGATSRIWMTRSRGRARRRQQQISLAENETFGKKISSREERKPTQGEDVLRSRLCAVEDEVAWLGKENLKECSDTGIAEATLKRDTLASLPPAEGSSRC